MSDTHVERGGSENAAEGAAESRPAPGTPPDPPSQSGEKGATLDARLEAVLFSSDLPLLAKRVAALLGAGSREILEAIDRLNVFYAETGRAFRIAALAGGFQLVTTPEHADLLGKLHKERVPTRLSRAALETLSIIAFKQPVTRSEIDAIRGVSASDRVLRHLIERKLVRICGRAEAPGRPLLYGTTREFLGYFGLSAVSDLPRTEELEALLAGDVPSSAGDEGELADEGLGDAPDRADAESASAAAAPGWPDPSEAGEDADDDDSRAEELLEESHPGEEEEEAQGREEDAVESHSGEESDDHEGVPSSQ